MSRPSLVHLLFAFLFAFCASIAAFAQLGADLRDPYERRRSEDIPKNVRETRDRMRIDKEKKDYDEMLERGEDAVKLTERIARSFQANGRLADTDLGNLETVEKDVKKIRSDLGGDDDDEKVDEFLGHAKLTMGDAINTLKDTTASLFDQLKKTSRFSISAGAIQSSNTVIKLARFLRFGK